MDSNEMASQLAQFSSMEATVKMSDNMEKLLANQTSTSNLQLLSMLNSQVQTAGNTVAVSGGKVSASEFTLKAAAGTSVIEIRDAADTLVWKQDKGAISEGTYAMSWDGKDLLGKVVADGAYHYEVKGTQTDGSDLGATYKTTAKVTGVNFNGATAQLTLDKYITAGVADVTSVLASGSSSGNSAPAATDPAATDPPATDPAATATGQ
jgi:flagellar basal-body rod modification protein FlgD